MLPVSSRADTWIILAFVKASCSPPLIFLACSFSLLGMVHVSPNIWGKIPNQHMETYSETGAGLVGETQRLSPYQ